jgi:regulatory protein
MKITAIKQQVKQTGRYSVFVDEKFAFGLSELGLISSGLATGQELTKQELEKFKEEAKTDKLYNRALDLIARRARSEWEMRDYLKRKDAEESQIEAILNKLRERSLLNDAEFARMWVENRRLLKATSKRRLTQELKQKRINEEVINEVLGNDETDEREVLRQLVERKKNRYPDKLKFMRYLASQGFNYDDIKVVLDDQDE